MTTTLPEAHRLLPASPQPLGRRARQDAVLHSGALFALCLSRMINGATVTEHRIHPVLAGPARPGMTWRPGDASSFTAARSRRPPNS
jgi:hypothetical protein